ncbi:hypothetical protein LBMAG53_27540 [Planctomycetota bacterium]|nr:hypothetical protein LBMAG53_27540 [Planctomycetota bacterium]
MINKIKDQSQDFPGECSLFALDLHNGQELYFNQDAVLNIASTYKLLSLICAYQKADSGDLDLSKVVTIEQKDHKPGSGILHELAHDLVITIRDLLRLMIIMSDNAAAIYLYRMLGGNSINAVAANLGLKNTAFHPPKDGNKAWASSTARELVLLMRSIICNEAASTTSCEEMRSILSRQFYMDQIGRFLPIYPYASDLGLTPRVTLRCKGGFGIGVRCDVGSVEFIDNAPLLIAVICNFKQNDPTKYGLLQEPASILNATMARMTIDAMRPGLIDLPYIPYHVGKRE